MNLIYTELFSELGERQPTTEYIQVIQSSLRNLN